LSLFEVVPRPVGEMIGGVIAIISGVSQGVLAAGFPRPIGDPLLEGSYAAVVTPLGLLLFLHGRQLRERRVNAKDRR
jgi:hypothetical protein